MFGRTPAAPAFIRCCKVYLSEKDQTLLVAPMFNHAGLFAERPGTVVSEPLGEPERLGELTRTALEGCIWQPEFNHRGRKETDWPAFQRSGCRSIREFKGRYDGLLVCGKTEANVVWEVLSATVGPSDTGAERSIGAAASDRELGECLLAVWKSYRELRERPSPSATA